MQIHFTNEICYDMFTKRMEEDVPNVDMYIMTCRDKVQGGNDDT